MKQSISVRFMLSLTRTVSRGYKSKRSPNQAWSATRIRPVIFNNLYSDHIFKTALNDLEMGIKVNAVECEIFSSIRKCELNYFGHINLFKDECYELLWLIMMGKIEEKRGIVRKKISWLNNIRQWTGTNSDQELFHVVKDSEIFINLVVNARSLWARHTKKKTIVSSIHLIRTSID